MSDNKSPDDLKHGSDKMVPEVDAANQKEVDITEEIGKINGQFLLPVPQHMYMKIYKKQNIFSHIKQKNVFKIFIADIDLADPEVEAAAAKIQAVFKMRGRKTLNKK